MFLVEQRPHGDETQAMLFVSWYRPGNLLAVSLGVEHINFGHNNSTFETAVRNSESSKMLFGFYGPDVVYLVIGFRSGSYGAFFGFTYNNTPDVKKLCQLYDGAFTWY